MSQEIASLFAKISADVSGYEKSMNGVRSDLTSTQTAMSKFADFSVNAFKVVAVAGAAIGAGIVAGVGASLKASADMEQGIADIGAMMTLTSAETVQLQDHIMELGLSPDLKVSATEAAGAVMSLGTAGLSMAEIMGGASEATVLLANATGLKGGEGFASAASIATDVMAQFNIKAENLDKAVSAIAGTTVASKFTIDDYRLAIAQAGGVAGSVGVEFDDFNAVIAATSPSFASGSDAGTSFKTFLQRLVPQTDKAKEALIQLGLSTGEDVVTAFFDAGGAMRPMEEISENLQNAFSGLSEAQKIEAASTIFGTDAMRTALALAEGGGEIITEMKKAIGNVDAEELAAKRMDTLSGRWDIFTGVVETLQLGLGNKFLPVAKKVIEWTTELATVYGPAVIEWGGRLADSMMGAVDWLIETVKTGLNFTDTFEGMPGPIQKVVTGVTNVVSAVGAFIESVRNTLKPITDLIAQHVSWTDVILGTAIAITAMLAPAIISAMAAGVAAAGAFIVAMAPVVIPIVAAIAAVAALRYAWENDLGNVREITAYVWGVVTAIFGNVTRSLGEVAEVFKIEWALVGDENLALGRRLEIIWEAIKDSALILFAGIVQGVAQLLVPFAATLDQWGLAAQQWIIDATAPTRAKLQEYLSAVVAWGTSVLTSIRDKFNEIKTAIVERVTSFIDTARTKIDQWRTWIIDKYESIRVGIVAKMEAIKNAVSEPVRNFIQETQDRIGGWYNFFVDRVGAIRDGVAERFGQMQSGISSWLQSVGSSWSIGWSGMGHATARSTGEVTESVKTGSGLWKGTWEDTLSYLEYWTSHGWKYAYYYPIVAWVNETALDIKNAWNNTVNNLKAIWTTIVDTAKDKWNTFKVDVLHIVNTLIKDLIHDFDVNLRVLKSNIHIELGWIERYWTDLSDWIVGVYEDIVADTGEWVKDTFAWFKPAEWLQQGVDLVQGLWDGMKRIWNNVKSWWHGEAPALSEDFARVNEEQSPSRVFERHGANLMAGLRIGVEGGIPAVTAAFSGLSSSISTAMSSVASNVASAMNSTMQSVVEGVRYGAGLVNLATADVVAQSLAAEQQARAAWERLRVQQAAAPPPVTMPPPLANPNPWGPGGTPPTGPLTWLPSPGTTPPTTPTTPTVPTLPPPLPPGVFNFGMGSFMGSLMNDFTDNFGATVNDLREFAQSANEALFNKVGAPLMADADYQDAYARANQPIGENVDRLLAAVQVLIQKLSGAGLGTQFNINQAPSDAPDNRTELTNLIAYLNALQV